MEHYTAYELHAVVDHVPDDFVAAGEPVVFPDGVVAVDAYEVLALGGQFAVKLGGLDHDGLVGRKAGGCLADHCEDFGQMLVELVLDRVEHGLLVAVDLVPDRLTLVKWKFFHFNLEAGVFLLLGGYGLADVVAHVLDALAQLVYGKLFHLRLKSLDFFYNWLDLLEVAGRFVAKNLGEK